MSGIHDTHFFMSGVHEHHISDWYPWYTIFKSVIHDTQYLCIVSMIHDMTTPPWCREKVMVYYYYYYPWYTIIMSGIHDTLSLSGKSGHKYTIFLPGPRLWFYVLWIPSRQIYPYQIIEETETLVVLSLSRHKVCDNDLPRS